MSPWRLIALVGYSVALLWFIDDAAAGSWLSTTETVILLAIGAALFGIDDSIRAQKHVPLGELDAKD